MSMKTLTCTGYQAHNCEELEIDFDMFYNPDTLENDYSETMPDVEYTSYDSHTLWFDGAEPDADKYEWTWYDQSEVVTDMAMILKARSRGWKAFGITDVTNMDDPDEDITSWALIGVLK